MAGLKAAAPAHLTPTYQHGHQQTRGRVGTGLLSKKKKNLTLVHRLVDRSAVLSNVLPIRSEFQTAESRRLYVLFSVCLKVKAVDVCILEK